MNGFVMSIATIAVLTGSLIYIKNSEIKTADNYKQAKTIVAYLKKEKDLNTLSNYKAGVEEQTLLIGSLKDKSLEKKFAKAMEIAMQTKQNPTCGDLAKTGEITYSECLNFGNKKNAFIKIQRGEIASLNTKDSEVFKMIKAKLSPNSYYLNKNIDNNEPIIATNAISNYNVKTNEAIYAKAAKNIKYQIQTNSLAMTNALKTVSKQAMDKIKENTQKFEEAMNSFKDNMSNFGNQNWQQSKFVKNNGNQNYFGNQNWQQSKFVKNNIKNF